MTSFILPKHSRSTSTHASGRCLGTSSSTVAPFQMVNDDKISMMAELLEEPDADNSSGMSGGPIFWSDESGWGGWHRERRPGSQEEKGLFVRRSDNLDRRRAPSIRTVGAISRTNACYNGDDSKLEKICSCTRN